MVDSVSHNNKRTLFICLLIFGGGSWDGEGHGGMVFHTITIDMVKSMLL